MKKKMINKTIINRCLLIVIVITFFFGILLFNNNNIISNVTLLSDYKESGQTTTNFYIENLVYSGTSNANNVISDKFSTNIVAYSDSNITLTSIPYDYINAEMLRLPNADNIVVSNSLISFEINKNSTVFIARDANVPNPLWLTDNYSLTTKTITASDGTIYQVWEKDYTITLDANNDPINTSIIIGGNADTVTEGNLGNNQIVFVKETSKVTNRSFYYQDFNLITSSNILNGLNGIISNSYLSIEKGTIDSRTGLHFTKTGSSELAYIQKEFANLDKPFIFEYKAYIAGISGNRANNWLRVFLSNGLSENKQSSEGTFVTNLGVESYLYKEENGGSRVYIKYRDYNKTTIKMAIDDPDVVVNNWYLYKYYVDPINRQWEVKVYDVTGTTLLAESGTILFGKALNDSNVAYNLHDISAFTFGTGANALYLTDYYIDDVTITPEMDIGASSITIDGTSIDLNEETNSYLLNNNRLPSSSTISITPTDDYYNHTITIDDDEPRITVNVENKKGNHYVFDVVYELFSVFDSWTVVPTETGSPDPLVTAISQIKDNADSFYFNDSSTTNNVYAYKNITANTSALLLSFDFYLKDDINYNQELLKIFLTNNLMNNITDYSNVAIRSYLTPQNGTTTENIMITKKVNSSDINDVDDTEITKNTWHNIQYIVNTYDQIYDIYLDDICIMHDIPFYTNQDSINYIYIGSDTIGTADFNIRNFVYHEVSGSPIDGVTIDQNTLTDFDNLSDTYIYYSDKELTNETNVLLVTNSFYKETMSVIKDFNNNAIVINVKDNLDDIHTYTIIYDNILNRPITIEKLQELVNYANNEFNEEDYTYNTWDYVTSALVEANRILAISNSTEKERSIAYYELEQSLSNLLYLYTYNGYDSSTVKTIQFSSNLKENNNEVFSFNKVLDNGKQVYFDNDTNLFTSIPYKYLNAEYLVLKNNNYKQALITLKTLKSIDLLVFKDRDAGPFTIDYDSTDVNRFVDTGEIAVSSEGIVYKIYKKTFDVNTDINIEFEEYVNNYISNNTNIIAFIQTGMGTNECFICENFDSYDATGLEGFTNTSLFERSWESFYPDRSIIPVYANTDINSNIISPTGSLRNSLHLNSSSVGNQLETYAWTITYKEMAKLNEVIEYTYWYKMDSIANNKNLFNRAWLRNAEGDYNDTTDSDKVHTAVETYLHGNLLYAQINEKKTNIITNISANVWHKVKVKVNLLTNKFTITFDNGSESSEFNRINKSGSNGNSGVNFVNYIYFASRYQGATDIDYMDVNVAPIDSHFYDAITYNGANISNFKDLTKAYLLNVPQSDYNGFTELNSPLLSVIRGSLTSTVSTLPTYNYYSNNNNKYSSISEEYNGGSSIGVYNRNYSIYYEVDSDVKNTANNNIYDKSQLVNLIKDVLNHNQTYYTSDSWDYLSNEIEDAKIRLTNHGSVISNNQNTDEYCTSVNGVFDSNNGTCTIPQNSCSSAGGLWNETVEYCNLDDVTSDYIELKYALDNLVSLSDIRFDFDGKIIAGKNYDEFNNNIVNITNKSSFTTNYNFESRISGEYVNADKVHTKFIETDASFVPGTKITLIDKSRGIEKYYYYIVTDSDFLNSITRYSLTNFIKAGTTDEHFVNEYHLDDDVLHSDYSILVDFNDTTGMSTGLHTITLELYIDGIKVTNSEILNYTIYDATTTFDFDVSFGNEVYSNWESSDVNAILHVNPIVIDGINVSDTTFDDMKLGTRVSVYNNLGVKISFPKGTTLIDDNTTYYLLPDGTIQTSRGLPVTDFDINYTLVPGFYGFSTSNYIIKIELIGSYDGFNEGKILATKSANVIVTDSSNCNIYAEITNGTNIVYKNSQDPSINVRIHTQCNYLFADQLITMSLTKKNNITTNDFGFSVVDLNQYVNNNIGSLFDTNMYTIITHENSSLINTDYIDDYTIHLKNNIDPGMYRIMFDIRSDNIIMTDFVSFIVK